MPQAASERDSVQRRPDDVRAEYEAVSTYHNFIIGLRFTIAGLYLAAMGFLAQAALSDKALPSAHAFFTVLLALIIWAACWMLELRSRGLYRNLAQRAVDIEHRDWGLCSASEWYQGFFSRQYKKPPVGLENDSAFTPPPPDATSIFDVTLPASMSKRITHSNAFDVLYAGTGLLWLAILFDFLRKLLT